MQTREIKVGTKFKHMKEEWICTSNDGFIFEADCLNKNCPLTGIQRNHQRLVMAKCSHHLKHFHIQ